MEITRVLDGKPYGEASCSRDYIEHHVSRLDTLPGLAIKYGVEVADIKRLNGLATDFQMYARKVLHIPLDRRHPPADSQMNYQINDYPRCAYSEPRSHLKQPIYPSFYSRSRQANGTALIPSCGGHVPRRKVTSAMGLLHGYYGLSTSGPSDGDGSEMLLHKSDQQAYSDDEPFTPPSVAGDRKSHKNFFQNGSSPSFDPIGLKGKKERANECSTSLDTENTTANKLSKESHTSAGDTGVPEFDRVSEKVVRRRAKVEGCENNEAIIPQDTGLGSSYIVGGKSPAPKPKASKGSSEMEAESSGVRLLPFAWTAGVGNPIVETGNLLGVITVEDLISKIKRSASAPSIQDNKKASQGNSAYTSGSQELSDAPIQGPMASIAKPFLEGLVKPGSRRNKAALD